LANKLRSFVRKYPPLWFRVFSAVFESLLPATSHFLLASEREEQQRQKSITRLSRAMAFRNSRTMPDGPGVAADQDPSRRLDDITQTQPTRGSARHWQVCSPDSLITWRLGRWPAS